MDYAHWENVLTFVPKMCLIANFRRAPGSSGMGNNEQLFNINISLLIHGFTTSNIISSENSSLSEEEFKAIQSIPTWEPSIT